MKSDRVATFSIVLYPEEEIVEVGLRRSEAVAFIATYNRIMKPEKYAAAMEEKQTSARLEPVQL